jgi:hypothetical protein
MVNGRLHSTEGPAWSYADGFCGYALDGVEVPEFVIDAIAGKIPAQKVLELTNVEQRLVAIKYVGAGNLLNALDGKVLCQKGAVQADGRPEYVLHQISLNGTPEKLLEMQNPSEPKRHYEFVPPEVTSCTEALAWRIGWDLKAFKEPKAKA